MPLIVTLRVRFNPVKPARADTHAWAAFKRGKVLVLTGTCAQTLSVGQDDAATNAGTSTLSPLCIFGLKFRHFTEGARFCLLTGVPVPYGTGV